MGYVQGEPRPEPYIPKAFGNRMRPPSEQIRAFLVAPTEAEKRRVHRRASNGMRVTVDEKGKPQAVEVSDDAIASGHELFCERFCAKLENYSHRERVVVTGADLAKYGESELVTEIGREIEHELSLSEEEKKTSAPSSDSSGSGTEASSGTAETVAVPASA